MLRNVISRAVAIAALLGSGVAAAGSITFTGSVGNDFNPAVDPTVNIIPRSNDPNHLPTAPWVPQGWISGFSIKDIRTAYDTKTDTLFVGVNTFAVAGNIENNGSASVPHAALLAHGGEDPANLGANNPSSDKSITVAFAPTDPTNAGQHGLATIVAGVPADKSTQGPGIDGFTVAKYTGDLGGFNLQQDYGATLNNHLGNLAFDPSLAHPGFEFTIANFSKGTGLDPTQPLWLKVYAGSARSIIGAKDGVDWTHIPAPAGQFIPEPATILVWTALVGAAACRLRRRVMGS